ncbi:MAG: peptidoglycan DD-metalloendopeptidase family protein, partial [Clostridia bacterium]
MSDDFDFDDEELLEEENPEVEQPQVNVPELIKKESKKRSKEASSAPSPSAPSLSGPEKSPKGKTQSKSKSGAPSLSSGASKSAEHKTGGRLGNLASAAKGGSDKSIEEKGLDVADAVAKDPVLKAGIKVAKVGARIQNKIDQAISNKTGVNKTVVKVSRKLMMYLAGPLLALILIVSIFDLILSVFDDTKDTADTLSKVQSEIGKDLLRFNDDDFQKLMKAFKDEYSKKATRRQSVLNKLVDNKASGTDKSRVDSALEALEEYMRTEKTNFNKVEWHLVNGQTGEKIIPQMYETADKLKLPITTKNFTGTVVDSYIYDGTTGSGSGGIGAPADPNSTQGALPNTGKDASGTDRTFEVTFYSDSAEENGGHAGLNAIGGNLAFGQVATRQHAYPYNTVIWLEGVGDFTVTDCGADWAFKDNTRLDMFIPRRNGESVSDYNTRVSFYGRAKIKGKVLDGVASTPEGKPGDAKPSKGAKVPKFTFSTSLSYVQSFGEKILAGAIKGYCETGLMPSITLAQGMLESGYGRSPLSTSSNNLFGIRADSRWDGPVAETEGNGKFRAYGSFNESVEDHTKFLKENPRYAAAGLYNSKDYRQQATALKAANYDTSDPEYVNHLCQLVTDYDLDAVDKFVLDNPVIDLDGLIISGGSSNGSSSDKGHTGAGTKIPWSYDGDFGNINEDETIELFYGYLQTWSIPYSLAIATEDRTYGHYVVDEMFHKIRANVYFLFNYTQLKTNQLNLPTESYEEQVKDVDEKGEVTFKTVIRWRIIEGGEPRVLSSSLGEVKSSAGKIKSFIEYAETFKGIISAGVKLISKDPSTESTSLGSVEVTGSPGPDGCSAKRVDTITWADTASQETPKVETYVLYKDDKPEKEPEKLTSNRIQAFMYNTNYGYEHKKYSNNSIKTAFQVIPKYHFDAADYVKENGRMYFRGEVTGAVNGGLGWPVPECTKSLYWYMDPGYFGGAKHNGIDISNEGKISDGHGPRVVAAAEGKVVKVVKNSGNTYPGGPRSYGNYVKIEHADGLTTLYGHLYSINQDITVGMTVAPGKELGYMGNTGFSDGIHLHFEVTKDGKTVDPFSFYNYIEKDMQVNGKWKKVKIYQSSKGGASVNGEMSAAWNAKMSSLIAEAIEMAGLRNMVYSQTNRPIKLDTRPNTGDCSSFVANLYYRYFDKAYLGGYSVPQYEMSELENIKATSLENWLDSNGNINTDVVRPGDVIVNRNIHTMLYIGSANPAKGPGTIIDHGHGPGPKFNDFNTQSASYKAQCRAIRYYRDEDLVTNSGGGSGTPSNPNGTTIFLSPSTQRTNEGVGSYGTEEKRCNQVADVVQRELV